MKKSRIAINIATAIVTAFLVLASLHSAAAFQRASDSSSNRKSDRGPARQDDQMHEHDNNRPDRDNEILEYRRATEEYHADNPALRVLTQRQRNSNPMDDATRKLKEAESSEDREQAMDEIRLQLEKQYDEFLAANEKQVEELQERLDKLREQLVRRREAKEKMVDLELERVVNESDGLIWPDRDRGNRNSPVWEYPARAPLGRTRGVSGIQGFPLSPVGPPQATEPPAVPFAR